MFSCVSAPYMGLQELTKPKGMCPTGRVSLGRGITDGRQFSKRSVHSCCMLDLVKDEVRPERTVMVMPPWRF